jgi:hypothetical protein
MAQGSKYTDEQKEKALALLATEPDIKKVISMTTIPRTTLQAWKAEAIVTGENENFVKLRQERKAEFVANSWRSIEKALQLAERRLDRALNQEEELDVLIDEIQMTNKEEMSQEAKNALISKIRALQIQTIKDISTFVGTMYDKQALANGDVTSKSEIDIKGELRLADKLKAARERANKNE